MSELRHSIPAEVSELTDQTPVFASASAGKHPRNARPPEIPESVLAEARARYARDGFCVAPPLLPGDLIARIPARMDAILDGEFETGVAPMWKPKEDDIKVRVIDQPHVADRVIYELISHPIIGRFAAAVTGAKTIQVWAVSLIHKPVGGAKSGGIGWHQDMQYFQGMWEDGDEDIFTAWVAVSDVTLDAGPISFVPGSQRWGLLNQGDFGDPDHAPVQVPDGEKWVEIPTLLSPGAFSLHHGLTFHGSGPNHSNGPRRGFALHLTAGNARPRPLTQGNPGLEYLRHLSDPAVCPMWRNDGN